MRELSSQLNTAATVDLKGNVDARSPFSVSGKINPLTGNLFADVTVTFTNTELTAFTPYMEKFAGRPLEKGKLSFAVHYLVNNKDLKAENGFFIDQLSAGAKNNSPDATHLPVKLAIALLRHCNGRIQSDVPVQGKIDDPKFKLGPIIWHVVVNLMEKAATSPFALLGSMFGGGEELSYVEFAPGQSHYLETETNKLNTLAKALDERPSLSLEISGSTDPAQDRPVLARQKLEDQLKAIWMRESAASNNTAMTASDAVLSPPIANGCFVNTTARPPRISFAIRFQCAGDCHRPGSDVAATGATTASTRGSDARRLFISETCATGSSGARAGCRTNGVWSN